MTVREQDDGQFASGHGRRYSHLEIDGAAGSWQHYWADREDRRGCAGGVGCGSRFAHDVDYLSCALVQAVAHVLDARAHEIDQAHRPALDDLKRLIAERAESTCRVAGAVDHRGDVSDPVEQGRDPAGVVSSYVRCRALDGAAGAIGTPQPQTGCFSMYSRTRANAFGCV